MTIHHPPDRSPAPGFDDVLADYMLRVDRGEAVDRDRFLADHPGCADALREFFAECDAIDDTVSRLGPDTGPAPDPSPRPPAAAPSRFGDYELIEPIGKGGMGVVYKARHVRLDRVVALKMMNWASEPTAPADLARFRREGVATARLDHPNIVPVYDVGAWAGRPYLAMKLVEGGNLRTHRGRFAGRPAEAARLVAAVARAVHHAHQRGILHRDLKPGNVFLDPADNPLVGDFGLAKWLDPEDGADEPSSSGSGAFGTPAYMAPEQVATGPRELTTGVDVYGLGAVLYELLTGRPPHVSGTPLGALVQVMLADPPPPRAIDRTVPRDLEVICLTCLAREPRNRYPSAVAVADDLDRWTRGEPILARPAGVAERARKWARRRPVLASLVVAGLIGVAAGGVALWTQLRQTSASLAEAEELRREEASKAESARVALEEAQAAQAAQTVTLSELAWRAGQPTRAADLLDTCPPAYRAWEWSYLKRLCRPPGALIAERGEELAGPSYAGGGRWVAAGGGDGVVRVWDAATGREVVALRGHAGAVTGVATGVVSEPGGRPPAERVVSVGRDGTLRVWDAGTGACVRQRVAHAAGPTTAVALGPDGAVIATTGADRTVRVWHADTLAEWTTIPSPGAVASAIALGPPDPYGGGARLAVGGDDGSVEVWDSSGWRKRRTLPGHGAVVRALAFSRDGLWLASAGGDHKIKVWDIRAGLVAATLTGHREDILGVAFAADSTRLASAGRDGSVRLWDRRIGRRLGLFRGHTGPVAGVAFHPDGVRLASAGADGRVWQWDARETQEVRHLGADPAQALSLAVSRDGSRLAIGNAAGVRVWDAQARDWTEPLVLATGTTGRVLGLAFDPDGRQVVAAGTSGTIDLWDADTGQLTRTLAGHSGWVRDVAVRPDGRLIASAGADRTVRLWNPDTGAEVRSLAAHPDACLGVAFSPDGTRLATAGADKVARVWNPDTGRELAAFRGHTQAVWGVAFSPDGRLVATTSADHTVRVWTADAGAEVARVGADGDKLFYRPAFSPDGRRLAVPCSDRTVKLLDPRTGREALALGGHDDEVKAVAFGGNGTVMVSMDEAAGPRVWEADPPDLRPGPGPAVRKPDGGSPPNHREDPQVIPSVALTLAVAAAAAPVADPPGRFKATTEADAAAWQQDARRYLADALRLDRRPFEAGTAGGEVLPFHEKVLRTTRQENFTLYEVELDATRGRRMVVIVTVPNGGQPAKKYPAVVCVHGHGGSRRIVYDPLSLYHGFAAELGSRYVTVSPEVGQHSVYETGRTLMGERLGDVIRCVDYLTTRPEVDADRIGSAGLSLGGEMTMWLAAMDPRVKATVSSGFLTTVANMRQGHCPCWDFKGFSANFDFADVYGLAAPRPILCQIGREERAPGGFPVDVAEAAVADVKKVYAAFGRSDGAVLDVHPGGHVVVNKTAIPFLDAVLRP